MNEIIFTIKDTLVIAKRNLLKFIRLPRLIVFSTIQPLMFLFLFNYVFGGAVTALPPGADNYTNFLLPGLIIQVVLFGTSQTTVGLAEDFSKGIIDRFRSLPMSNIAVIAGRILADSTRSLFIVILMIIAGYIIGFRFQTGLIDAITAVIIAVSFGFTFQWISAFIGASVAEPETAQVAGFIWLFPLVFASSVFVPPQTMPDWLRVFAENQPITVTVDAIRYFALGIGSIDSLWKALAWMIGIILIFAPLSAIAFRKRS